MTTPTQLPNSLKNEIVGLTETITQIVENFKKLHNPLVESTEFVPKATEQLDKISQQTEQAAHKMLDRIEKITMREEDVIGGLKKIAPLADGTHASELQALINSLTDMAGQNRDDAYQIMDALQFQDITAQQMNHAAALLEEIEGKLKLITGILLNEQAGSAPKSDAPPKKERAYDPHADFVDKQAHQKDIDSMFAPKK
jgi:chemotaxis regulatin CheY-phosphate phosphatase CheZ